MLRQEQEEGRRRVRRKFAGQAGEKKRRQMRKVCRCALIGASGISGFPECNSSIP